MSQTSIHDLVASQFGANAASYVTSATHADEKSLAELVEIVAPKPTDELLDVATGAGHTALAFAPRVARVVAYDLTPQMLEETARAARDRGLTNVETRQGLAEQMPFAEKEFDIVTVRTAPHHFADIDAFLHETYRVLKHPGSFLMVDTTVPEDRKVADELNHLEKLRDPSHGRNLSPSEWRTQMEAAGFEITYIKIGKHANGKKMELRTWMDRIGTPEGNREEILGAFTNPTPEMVEELQIERIDGSIWFTLSEVTLLGTKVG